MENAYLDAKLFTLYVVYNFRITELNFSLHTEIMSARMCFKMKMPSNVHASRVGHLASMSRRRSATSASRMKTAEGGTRRRKEGGREGGEGREEGTKGRRAAVSPPSLGASSPAASSPSSVPSVRPSAHRTMFRGNPQRNDTSNPSGPNNRDRSGEHLEQI